MAPTFAIVLRWHGFALNVEAQTLLSWFKHLVACGIHGKVMTAVKRELALRIKAEEELRPDREASLSGEESSRRAVLDDPALEIEPGLLSQRPDAQCLTLCLTSCVNLKQCTSER